MATDPSASPTSSLVDRAKNIILQPKTEWLRIDAEPATVAGIYRSYVVVLAAIPPVCLLLGLLLIGGGYLGFSWVLSQAILTYLGYLVGLYLVALLIDALAPHFGGMKNIVSAFKVAAYSATAAFVCGLVLIIPFLFPLMIVGAIYSLYLAWLGLPLLMKVPADKSVPYALIVLVGAIILCSVVGAVANRVAYSMFAPAVSSTTITFTAPRP